jgi:hypothetical protein
VTPVTPHLTAGDQFATGLLKCDLRRADSTANGVLPRAPAGTTAVGTFPFLSFQGYMIWAPSFL